MRKDCMREKSSYVQKFMILFAALSKPARKYCSTSGLLVFVVILWGINVVMIKYLTTFFPPLSLAPIRLFLATCLLLPIVISKYGFQRPPQSALFPMLGVSLFAIFLHHITLSSGIALTSGTHAALILGLNPLLTALLASRLAAEPLTWFKGLGICFGFSGVILVVSGKIQGTATLFGDFVMFLAMLTAVIGSLFVKKSTANVAPLIVTAYTHAVATLALIIFGCFVNPIWIYEGAFDMYPLSVLLFSSLVNTALGALWWNMGIQRIGASKSSLFQNGIPVAGVFASAFFLNEPLEWNYLAALCFVILGVSLGTGSLNLQTLNRILTNLKHF
ncbi:DMT family transporter [Anaerosinus massiliensis]|uniref:DMT family transporter n=1 Tax=Massilibacillus massiliensis TaxID=1806837 RepID=UPI0018FE6C11|nr:DMT family transporter [Massilibacillus massiliensis]